MPEYFVGMFTAKHTECQGAAILHASVGGIVQNMPLAPLYAEAHSQWAFANITTSEAFEPVKKHVKSD